MPKSHGRFETRTLFRVREPVSILLSEKGGLEHEIV